MVTLFEPADLRAEGDRLPGPCNWPWRFRRLTGFDATDVSLGGSDEAPRGVSALIHHRHVPPRSRLHMSRHCGCPLPSFRRSDNGRITVTAGQEHFDPATS